jgi:hypothetical protein
MTGLFKRLISTPLLTQQTNHFVAFMSRPNSWAKGREGSAATA